MPNILLTFSEINSKLKGGYRSNDQEHVNIQDNIRHVYCKSSHEIGIFEPIALKSNIDIYIYVPSNSLNSLDTQNSAHIF